MKKARTYHPRNVKVDGYRCREHPSYSSWANMMSRCYDPKNSSYKNYGARGITVCPDWHHFGNFAADMGVRPNKSLSIDRVDNNSGYSKANCRWANKSDQCVNRRKFDSNTTNHTGVVRSGSRYSARFDYEGRRYHLGIFNSASEASAVRETFVKLFFGDRFSAMKMVAKDTVWVTSKTRCRGVTPHKDGGFIARCTVSGVRHYVGYFKTLQEAINERVRFIDQATR